MFFLFHFGFAYLFMVIFLVPCVMYMYFGFVPFSSGCVDLLQGPCFTSLL